MLRVTEPESGRAGLGISEQTKVCNYYATLNSGKARCQKRNLAKAGKYKIIGSGRKMDNLTF